MSKIPPWQGVRDEWHAHMESYVQWHIAEGGTREEVFGLGAMVKAMQLAGERSGKSGQSSTTAQTLMIYNFMNSGEKVYVLAEDFGRQLYRTNLEIRADVLREMGAIYVHFPTSVQEKGSIQGMYVTTIKVKDSMLVSMLIVTDDGCIAPFYLVLRPAQTLQETLDDFVGDMESKPQNFDCEDYTARELSVSLRYLVKCVVYIQSGDPDLRDKMPVRTQTQNPKKVRRHLRENPVQIPVTLVGYSYKKGFFYRVDSTTVTGHFRWQPYGVGMMQVKLIWIDEHERRYQQTLTATPAVSPQ